MISIQTAPNILTQLSISFTGMNIDRNRWEITFTRKETNLIGGNTAIIRNNITISIFDTPETPIIDEEGNQTGTNPATTDLTDFMASWSTLSELIDVSFQKVIARENIVEWDGTIIDDIENDPEAETIKPWIPNELVAAPNRRSYAGKVYVVIQPHTTLSNWTPDITPALWNYLFDEDNGGEGLQPWIQPTGANPYPLGAQVTHNGLCWESANAANVWQPGAPGIGSNIWFEIPCP